MTALQQHQEIYNGTKIATYRRTTPKIGRNDLCPCHSGRKFKHCCLNPPPLPTAMYSEAMPTAVVGNAGTDPSTTVSVGLPSASYAATRRSQKP